jgi:succinoglycan biosynthesis protein ExoL
VSAIGYLAHDLSDPAIGRRVAMLRAGGATVKVAGLLRGQKEAPALGDAPPLVLGRSEDMQLARRATLIGLIMLTDLDRLATHFAAVDVLIARNLEMLVIAQRLLDRFVPDQRPRLVYECLDIHRLLIAQNAPGSLLRAIERRAGRGVDLVLTSSPAFVTHHLGHGTMADNIMLVENKVLDLSVAGSTRPVPATPAGPPWRIGWFGALRCRKSFDLLCDVARLADGRIEIDIRGRPSPAIFDDLAAEAERAPHVHFGGEYNNATELAALYGAVHFAWCVDFYEEGANSAWLLPNRLYESGFHNTLPIALASVETGRFLQRHGFGLQVDNILPEELAARLGALDAADYAAMLAQLQRLPRGLWSADAGDCVDLVDALAGRTPPAPIAQAC